MITVTLTERQFKVIQIALDALLRDIDYSLDHQWLSIDPLDKEMRERITELCNDQFSVKQLKK